MAKYFNTEGSCKPEEHYMVKLDDRMARIKRKLIDRKKYFVINRGRQYGKTTTLQRLTDYLSEEYLVFSLDFQGMPDEKFKDSETFSAAFVRMLQDVLENREDGEARKLHDMLSDFAVQNPRIEMDGMFKFLSRMCRENVRPIVLMIDEVDSAGSNEVFVKFLALLRRAYLNRDQMPIFHSVILAGVYSIKNLKLKLRSESEHQYNSSWNIAADFDIDMDFSVRQIAGMLTEYEYDYHTGMDIQAVSEEIYAYTSGYPVLVSFICKRIDEKIMDSDDFEDVKKAWSHEGIEKAVKEILMNSAPLFESMIRHLNEYPEMKKMFQAILFQGSDFSYSPDTKEISFACMFGYAVNVEGKVRIANRIFETRLYNYFLSEEELSSTMGKMAQRDKSYFVHDGKLDMDMTLIKFVDYFTEIYGANDERFIEDYGRKFFLLYLKPIINGVGNYYIEAQTRDARRTDVIVDYLGEQFIIELKIWHGNEYNERGEKQLMDYLDYYHKDKGYMLSFNFNKNKKIGVNEIRLGNKTIVEAVV